MLWTENLEQTVAFYSDVLGFKADVVNLDWGWASLTLDDASIMFSTPLNYEAPRGFEPPAKIGCTGSFYFNTDDVDALWDRLKDKVTVSYELESFEHGMREFAVYDNNGYILQFGQEIEE
jgi:uncharacterized glyoxalase superfamily protein PhnB